MSLLNNEPSSTPFQKFIGLLKYSFISQVIFFVTIPIIFTKYESGEYGIFTIAFSIASIVGTLSALRLERAIVIEESKNIKQLLVKCFSYVLVSSLLCIVILYFALQPFELSEQIIGLLSLLGASYCFVFGAQQIFIHIAIRQERVMLTGVSDITYSICLVVLLIVVQEDFYNQAVTLISIFLFSRLISNAPYYLLNIKTYLEHGVDSALSFSERFKYHIPVLTVLVANLQSKGLFYLTGLYYGSSVTGDLSMSQRVTYAPVNLFGATLRKSFFLEFTTHGRNKDHIAKYIHKILNYGSFISIAILPIFVVLISTAEQYIPEGWELFSKFTIALYPAASILVLLSWLDRIYDARHRQKTALFYEITFTILLYLALVIAVYNQASSLVLILIFTTMTVVYNLIWAGITLRMISLKARTVYLPAAIHLMMLVFCIQYLL